jgi:hypothetical protein
VKSEEIKHLKIKSISIAKSEKRKVENSHIFLNLVFSGKKYTQKDDYRFVLHIWFIVKSWLNLPQERLSHSPQIHTRCIARTLHLCSNHMKWA